MQKFSIVSLLLITMLPYLSVAANGSPGQPSPKEPVKIGIARLTHGHIHGFFSRFEGRSDLELVGIHEPDTALARRIAKRYDLDSTLFYTDLHRMIEEENPAGIAIFSNTFEHKSLVETIASAGVDIMLEKPLAVSMEHARAMQKAVRENNVHLIVNYETSWYASNRFIHQQVVAQNKIGNIRKMVVRSGHRGPKEIGVTDPFLSWLTDPKLNGGGALTDFGCYGANLMTWLMGNQRPITVTALTQQLKDDPVYAKVDDEATIILEYPHAQGIIQASWNWPYSRKDMEVYGTNGMMLAPDHNSVEFRYDGQQRIAKEVSVQSDRFDHYLSYFSAILRDRVEPKGLSSLENNMIVTEILDAARKSARTGKSVSLE